MNTALLSALKSLLNAVLTVAAVIGLWYALLEFGDLEPMVVKNPQDVFAYLFTDAEAGEHRSVLWDGLSQTLSDAAIGYGAGLAAAVLVAMAFILSRVVEQSFMPIAMILRSVPLVAMTPVLTLVFGRGLMATTVITGIVVFVPALVNMVFGLRSAPSQAADLVRAYGGGTGTVLRKVMLPSAMPAFFLSARISVPGALVGAMLAEWLATGKGLGQAMLRSTNNFKYAELWSSVVAITVASMVLYGLVAVAEKAVLRRFGPTPDAH
ncbi:MAG: ABC transporter permease subunit [Streptomycetaceae bacterium]|nr:ABC transporter permease subunit [Streptomycetaceae bacterium]